MDIREPVVEGTYEPGCVVGKHEPVVEESCKPGYVVGNE